MSKPVLKSTDSFPTSAQQQAAVDTVVRMALLEGGITAAVVQQLGSLQREAGLRVATIMIMLAGAAVPDTRDWQGLLQEHLAGSAPKDVAQ